MSNVTHILSVLQWLEVVIAFHLIQYSYSNTENSAGWPTPLPPTPTVRGVDINSAFICQWMKRRMKLEIETYPVKFIYMEWVMVTEVTDAILYSY